MKRQIRLFIIAMILTIMAGIGANILGATEGATLTAVASSSADQIDSTIVNHSSYGHSCIQVSCEEKGGIYFLNSSGLYFYNISTGKTEEIDFLSLYDDDYYKTTFSGKSYAKGNYLYISLYHTSRVLTYNSTYGYSYYSYNYTFVIAKYDMVNQCISSEIEVDATPTSFVVADNGRILAYISGELVLYSSDGTQLATATTDASVTSIVDYDSSTGQFYVTATINWVYWGYDHDMTTIMKGSISGSTISLCTGYNILVCQNYYYQKHQQVEAVDGKYVFIDNTFTSRLEVLDYSEYAPEDGETYVTTISLNTGSLLDNYYGYVFALSRYNYSTGSFDSADASGTRTLYCSDRNSIITLSSTTTNTLTEYSMTTGDEMGSLTTTYPVFKLLWYGDDIVAIEKDTDGNYYVERLEWTPTTKITVKAKSSTIKVGNTTTLSVTANGNLTQSYTYSTSDSQIVSVNKNGKITGRSVGTADITVTNSVGISATVKIKVVANTSIASPVATTTTLSGTKTSNISANNYSVYGSTVTSYLTENSDGTFTRVEYTGKKIIVETYSKDCSTLKSNKTLEMELGKFGGVYFGENYNFVVYGANNTSESDSKEVIRVVKYSKSWTRIDSASIKGANTYYPFNAGSLRMTEAGGSLYIYTCHTMYATSDGYHHQANMTFVINESTMETEQSYYDIMNLSYGYVSHSFNQFIQTDGTYVYRVDHGDSYPRAISITACAVGGSITSVGYTYAIDLSGVSPTSSNATGASVGGFEISSDGLLIAGNCVDYTSSSAYVTDTRNIFVSCTDADTGETTVNWFTKYGSSSTTAVRTPQLVKINDDTFLLMWEEYDSSTEKVKTAMVLIDGSGNKLGSVVRKSIRLSDCQPIYCSDGYVRWYVTGDDSNNDTKPTLYTINPYSLSAVNSVSKGNLYKSGNYIYKVTKVAKGKKAGTVTLINVVVKKATVKIPATITIEGKTYKVTAVGKNAFKNNKTIKKLVIGKNVKTIGASAFSGCTKLKKVTFGKNVKTIGKKAFYNCKKLKTVKLGNKVTTIGASAFQGCKKLSTLTLGTATKKIGKKAFYKCTSLKSITINSTKLTAKNVKANAFGKTKSSAKVVVPASKKAAYKTLLTKKGISKKAIFTS